ncbi:MAG: imidazole glycerol phosphate synthase subunit HisH [Trueperaceae bacterium]|nr:imidazole glycerol phosphate synthase subunit HisH [Trueperaceae bacterium]
MNQAPRAAVIDYGAGNLRSVERALAAVGFEVRTLSTPAPIAEGELLVLPGQGRFGQVMRAFKSSGFLETVAEHLGADRPFLGICVGLQLLLEGSEEDPEESGLGLVPGQVRRFPSGVSVPQMGWNRFAPFGGGVLLDGLTERDHVYFANSYYADVGSWTVTSGARSEYGGVSYLSALSRGNLHATQFHPEKSQAVGLRVLANLGRAVARA